MALGPHIHPWARLRIELARLASITHGSDAYVLDAWGNIWCVGIDTETTIPFGLLQGAIDELGNMKPALQRGGRIDGALKSKDGCLYARSFASVYVVLITFSAPYSPALVRKAVQSALPKIEALTLALPPPDGPMSGSGTGIGGAA